MKINCIAFIIFLFSSVPIFAQSITEEELIVKIKTQKIEMLNDYICYVSNTKNDINSRKLYVEKALALFVNNGEGYECNGVPTKGSFIQNLSKIRSVKDYFKGLINMQYYAITIIRANFAVLRKEELESMVKTEHGKYFVTCYVENSFCGIRDNRPIYQDITPRKVCLYLDESQINMIDNERPLVLLLEVYGTEKTRTF